MILEATLRNMVSDIDLNSEIDYKALARDIRDAVIEESGTLAHIQKLEERIFALENKRFDGGRLELGQPKGSFGTTTTSRR